MSFRFYLLLITILNTGAIISQNTDTSFCNKLYSLFEIETDDNKCKDYLKKIENICEENLKNKKVEKKIRDTYLKYKALVYNEYGIRNETEGNIQKAIENYNISLQIREGLNDKEGISSSLNNIGLVYSNQGLADEAMKYFNKSLQIATEINDKESIATTLNNIGLTYNNLGDIPKVLDYYHKSLKIREEIGNKEGIAISLNNIAMVFVSQNDDTKALEYYQRSLTISEEIGNKKLIATTLNNIGYMYKKNENYSKALEYYSKSLNIREELKNKVLIATSLNNIGIIYKNLNDYNKAMDYYLKGLKLCEEAGDKEGISNSLSNISNLLLKQERYKEAREFAERSLLIAKEIGYPTLVKSASGKLSKIYAKTGNYKDAYDMQILFMQMKDSINNESTRMQSVKSQFKYEYEKKAATDSIRTIEEKKLITVELNQEKTKRYVVLVGLIILLVFTSVLFNRFKVIKNQKKIIELKELETQVQKNIIEEKHNEIQDSIIYAKRIQYSLLASDKLLHDNLHDYFLFFKPKDFVSGDFYWGTKVVSSSLSSRAESRDENFVLVTADSTGHGVPGAIMSMLNIACLNEAINADKLTQPADILNATRKKVIQHLSNDGSDGGGKDGMDCSLVSFDFKNKKLIYAAANNPIWIVRSNSPAGKVEDVEFIALKADRMPVGKHDKDTVPFTQYEFELQSGDMVYTLTDGFPDQFGGPNGKKFKYKQLEQLLISISHESMDVQKHKLEEVFENWKGNLEQVDDVCVIGIRI